MSQGYVSKAEAGRLEVTGSRLSLYAAALGYPPPSCAPTPRSMALASAWSTTASGPR